MNIITSQMQDNAEYQLNLSPADTAVKLTKTPSIKPSAADISGARFPVAIYSGFYQSIPTHQEEFTFDELVNFALNGGGPYLTEDKYRAPYFTGPMKSAPFVGKTREKAINAGKAGDDLIGVMRSKSHSLGGAVYKHDWDDVPEDEFKQGVRALAATGLAFVIYTTFKHGTERGLVRARVLTFGDRVADPDEFAKVSEFIGLALLGRSYDESEHMAYQLAGIWMCPNERFKRAKRIVQPGKLIDTDAAIETFHSLPGREKSANGAKYDGGIGLSLNNTLGGSGDWGGSLDDLKSALWAISPDTQEMWSRVAFALYPLGEIGLGLYLKWSEECDTAGLWDRGEAVKKWNDKASTWATQDGTGRVQKIFTIARDECGWVHPGNKAEDQSGVSSEIILTKLSDIEIEKITWLWDGYLARGKFHLLAGHAGVSKTTVALTMAGVVTTGGKWPDGTKAELGNVLIWTGEDDIADTIKPRLVINGADPNRVFSIAGARGEDGKPRPFDPATDMSALRGAAQNIPGGVSLLIVDPIVSAIRGDGHRNAEVRRDLQELVDLGAELDCAILGITHLSKGTRGSRIGERVTGSLAFNALARVVLGCAQMAEGDRESGQVALFRSKSNIGPDSGGFYYDLEQGRVPGVDDIFASKVTWRGPVEEAADEVMARSENGAGAEQSKGEVAVALILSLLTDGPVLAKDILAEGKSLGISQPTMNRAKATAKVRDDRWGFGAGAMHWWYLSGKLPADWNDRKAAWQEKKAKKPH